MSTCLKGNHQFEKILKNKIKVIKMIALSSLKQVIVKSLNM